MLVKNITIVIENSRFSFDVYFKICIFVIYSGCAGVATDCFAAAGVPLGMATGKTNWIWAKIHVEHNLWINDNFFNEGPVISASAALTACNEAYSACYPDCTVDSAASTR